MDMGSGIIRIQTGREDVAGTVILHPGGTAPDPCSNRKQRIVIANPLTMATEKHQSELTRSVTECPDQTG